jgi:hypothetical protein
VHLAVLLSQLSDLRCAELRLKSNIAWLRCLQALRRCVQLAVKAGFDPDQPRDDHGRWTDAGGEARLAQAEGAQRYSVVLSEEEARGGHAIRVHVGKSDEELLATLRAMRVDTPLITVAKDAQGAFASLDSANDFVNRVLEFHTSTIDLVATGALDEAWLSLRFGYQTGREAFRPDAYAEPYIRNTYSVGVFIEHAPRSERGYTVITAHPLNERPKQ